MGRRVRALLALAATARHTDGRAEQIGYAGSHCRSRRVGPAPGTADRSAPRVLRRRWSGRSIPAGATCRLRPTMLVIDPAEDHPARLHDTVYDASGDAGRRFERSDRAAWARAARSCWRASIADRHSTFAFPPAFMKEARLPGRCGMDTARRCWPQPARWSESGHAEPGRSHHPSWHRRPRRRRRPTSQAFDGCGSCLKMILNWRNTA